MLGLSSIFHTWYYWMNDTPLKLELGVCDMNKITCLRIVEQRFHNTSFPLSEMRKAYLSLVLFTEGFNFYPYLWRSDLLGPFPESLKIEWLWRSLRAQESRSYIMTSMISGEIWWDILGGRHSFACTSLEFLVVEKRITKVYELRHICGRCVSIHTLADYIR